MQATFDTLPDLTPWEIPQYLFVDDVCAAERLVPIDQVEPNDVFLVGYPKSGNTWFQNLAAGAVYGVLPEFAPPSFLHLDLVPDVHQKRFYKRYSNPMFFKSHHLPLPEYRRVVYLLRDGRDVMVSYFRALEARQKIFQFEEMVAQDQQLFPCKWHEHVATWMKNPFGAEMLIVKYEDLHADPVRELKRFCRFARIERPDDFLEMVAGSAAFAKLQGREKRLGRAVTTSERQPNKPFFRRGIVGSYQDEMPENVRAAFLTEATEALQAAGYAV